MRILFCVDTDKNLDNLGKRLSKVLNLFNEELYYVDVFHVYRKPQADAPHLPTLMTEIQEDEERLRMNFLSDCQHIISNVLEKKLKKAALVNSHLEQGNFMKKFKEQIKFHKYELIVLLPGQKDPLQLLLMGRHVTKLVSKIGIPMLILPKDEVFEKRKTKFIGMLEKPKKQRKKFKKNKVIRQIKEDALRFIHICKHSDAVYEHVDILNHKNRITAFEEFHTNRRANHIYILNHKPEKGFAKWKKSSFTKAILAKNDSSILVI